MIDFFRTLKYIIQAVLTMVAQKTIGLPEFETEVIKQRTVACSDCPLREGNWCSSKKAIAIRTGELEMTPFGFEDWVYKTIKGCGCFLPLKKLSDSECPLQRWVTFEYGSTGK